MTENDSTAQRIAIFLPNLGGGGAERALITLSGQLAVLGYKVDLVVGAEGGELADEVPGSVGVVKLGAERVARAWWPLLRYVRRSRPHALLSTLEHANVLVILLSPFMRGTRVVIREANTATVDTGSTGLGGKALLAAMRAFYPAAPTVIAVSEGVASELKGRLGVPPEKIRVIANPVITPELFELAKQPLTDPWFEDDVPVVLAVGRLVPQKGFDTLLDAFAGVKARRPDARLLVLGEGPLRGDLERRVKELGLTGSVRLPGFIRNPFPYMANADVFVLSSRWEGLPNALIQAMAVGAPVVATDCRSGPDEILEGNRYGHLVPVDEPSSMSQAILGVLDGDKRIVDQEWTEKYLAASVARQYAAALGVR